MKYTRFYTGTDGETHFEDVEITLGEPRNSSRLSTLEKTTGIIFRETSGDYYLDWHNAPRRQYIIILEGRVEIEVSDGTVRRFGPGDIMLAEDTTGRGHISRAVDNETRTSIFITLD